MARIYYVGDWAIMMGPVFAEGPFNYEYKGVEIFNYGKWLVEALESAGHEVRSVPAWDFYRLGPGDYEEVLRSYDLLVFSDVEARNFQLHPSFFDRSKFGAGPLTFPDRIRLTVEAVRDHGKAALFLDGWLSFNGECGKGGWGRTGLAEILPATCLDQEDLRESTEGYRMTALAAGHPALGGLDLGSAPPILGYNVTRPRPGAEVLAEWVGTRDPALAVAEVGSGRVAAYTSDPSPHWGCNLVYWEGYATLWSNLAAWLTGRA